MCRILNIIYIACRIFYIILYVLVDLYRLNSTTYISVYNLISLYNIWYRIIELYIALYQFKLFLRNSVDVAPRSGFGEVINNVRKLQS